MSSGKPEDVGSLQCFTTIDLNQLTFSNQSSFTPVGIFKEYSDELEFPLKIFGK